MEHGKANAQDTEFCTAISEGMAEIEGLPSRAVLITGHGRFFSGGVDLKRVVAGGVDYLRDFVPALVRCFESVFFHPKPVVIAVNGHAIAGGCILACCGDRRLMSDDERAGIGVPELHVGVPFPAAALEILRYACSPRHLQMLVGSGRSLRPGEALEAGLVDALAAPDALESEALAGCSAALASVRPEVFAAHQAATARPGSGPHSGQRRCDGRSGFPAMDFAGDGDRDRALRREDPEVNPSACCVWPQSLRARLLRTPICLRQRAALPRAASTQCQRAGSTGACSSRKSSKPATRSSWSSLVSGRERLMKPRRER